MNTPFGCSLRSASNGDPGVSPAYSFRGTLDRCPAPVPRVQPVLLDLERYPEWWPQVRAVAKITDDDARVLCRSVLPYTLDLLLHAERREPTAPRDQPGRRPLTGWSGGGSRRRPRRAPGWTSSRTCTSPVGLLRAALWYAARPLLHWNHDRYDGRLRQRGLRAGWPSDGSQVSRQALARLPRPARRQSLATSGMFVAGVVDLGVVGTVLGGEAAFAARPRSPPASSSEGGFSRNTSPGSALPALRLPGPRPRSAAANSSTVGGVASAVVDLGVLGAVLGGQPPLALGLDLLDPLLRRRLLQNASLVTAGLLAGCGPPPPTRRGARSPVAGRRTRRESGDASQASMCDMSP